MKRAMLGSAFGIADFVGQCYARPRNHSAQSGSAACRCPGGSGPDGWLASGILRGLWALTVTTAASPLCLWALLLPTLLLGLYYAAYYRPYYGAYSGAYSCSRLGLWRLVLLKK